MAKCSEEHEALHACVQFIYARWNEANPSKKVEQFFGNITEYVSIFYFIFPGLFLPTLLHLGQSPWPLNSGRHSRRSRNSSRTRPNRSDFDTIAEKRGLIGTGCIILSLSSSFESSCHGLQPRFQCISYIVLHV